MSNTGDRRGGRVWARQVAYVVRRDAQYGCYLAYDCCTGAPQTADHIVPYDPEDPSLDRYDNLAGACMACNQRRGNDPLAYDQLSALGARGLGPLAGAPSPKKNPPSPKELGPLKILFDGAGKPSHRKLLESMGVKSMMVSYWDLTRVRRVPQKGFDDLMLRQFPEDVEIYLDSGWAKASKLTADEQEAYAEEYTAFLDRYRDRVTGATEPHLSALGADWLHRWRKAQGPDMGEGVWPVWTQEDGMHALESLAKSCGNVALAQGALEGNPVLPPQLGVLHRQYQTRFHALSCANPDTLKHVALATASTQSWASPQMRGETIVWDGQRIVRYRADLKDQARARYGAVVEKAGLDYQAILADDSKEVTRLAIWSYQQLESLMSTTRPAAFGAPFSAQDVTHRGEGEEGANAQTAPGGVGDRPQSIVNESGELEPAGQRGGLVPRPSSERMRLPVFAVHTEQVDETRDGETVTRDKHFIKSEHASIRQCNTCVIKGRCPAYEPDSNCKFDLPIEVRTKDQLKSLLSSVVEMQGQRVAFARFAEEVNGGYPDPNLSQEIDRLFNLVSKVQKMEDNREFERITIERQVSGGVLSNLFGERAATQVQQLPPVPADHILEATVLEES